MTRKNAVKYLENKGFIITPIIIQCELAGGHITVGWKAQRESDGLVIKSNTKCGLVRIYKNL